MNVAKDPATLLPASTLNLRPLLLANMACTMSMMAFVALIGPIARQLGMATWQAGAAVTVAGVVWVLLARPWGRAANRLGHGASCCWAAPALPWPTGCCACSSKAPCAGCRGRPWRSSA